MLLLCSYVACLHTHPPTMRFRGFLEIARTPPELRVTIDMKRVYHVQFTHQSPSVYMSLSIGSVDFRVLHHLSGHTGKHNGQHDGSGKR